MAGNRKVSPAKSAAAAVEKTTANADDSQAPKDKTELLQAQTSGGAPSTGAPSGAVSTDSDTGADAGAAGGETGSDAGTGDGAAAGPGDGAGAGAGGEVTNDAQDDADPAALDTHDDSNPATRAWQLFGVVIRNHGSHAVNAGPGLLLLPCSTTPIPQPQDAEDLKLLRAMLANLEREHCLRPDTLTADVTKIMENQT